jgi:hypothetical protein
VLRVITVEMEKRSALLDADMLRKIASLLITSASTKAPFTLHNVSFRDGPERKARFHGLGFPRPAASSGRARSNTLLFLELLQQIP